MMRKLIERIRNQKGATMIEYTLLAALISIVALVAITGAGQKVLGLFNTVQGAIP